MRSVMQAGRWKPTRMPMRYGEGALAGPAGMSRAANAQGRALRDSRVPALRAPSAPTYPPLPKSESMPNEIKILKVGPTSDTGEDKY